MKRQQSAANFGSHRESLIDSQRSFGKQKQSNLTGIAVSKSYQMLCGGCFRQFTKVMVVEMSDTAEDRQVTLFDLQLYFNSTLSKLTLIDLCAKTTSTSVPIVDSKVRLSWTRICLSATFSKSTTPDFRRMSSQVANRPATKMQN